MSDEAAALALYCPAWDDGKHQHEVVPAGYVGVKADPDIRERYERATLAKKLCLCGHAVFGSLVRR